MILLLLPTELKLQVIGLLSNADLLNLRLVCHNFNALILAEYEICQTITGYKECVPKQKANYFKNSTPKVRNEFKDSPFTAAEL
jgi:hypothetical protein